MEESAEQNSNEGAGKVLAQAVANSSIKGKKTARFILGDDYEGLMNFFIGLFLCCLKLEIEQPKQRYYVAFMTRRCHVLEQIFYDFIIGPEWADAFGRFCQEIPTFGSQNKWKAKLEEIRDQHYITDTSLVTMCAGLEEDYEKGRFPRIIVADELLIHGRSINGLFYQLEDNMIAYLREKRQMGLLPEGCSEEGLVECLKSQVEIHVYKGSTENVLLMDSWKNCSKVGSWKEPAEWRKTSMRMARLISVLDVANVTYSWCLKRPVSTKKKRKNRTQTGHFRVFDTSLWDSDLKTAIWLYPSAGAPRAVLTVRTRDSLLKGSNGTKTQLTVPFLFYDHLKKENVARLHEKILSCLREHKASSKLLYFFNCCDEKGERYKSLETVYYRRLSETNELFLNVFLLKRYLREVEGTEYEALPVKEIAYSQVIRNYVVTSMQSKDTIEGALSEIWELSFEDDLEAFLDIYLNDVPPIEQNLLYFGDGPLIDWESLEPEDKEAKQSLIHAVEDTISETGYHAERNSYLDYASRTTLSEKSLSEWGKRFSLTAFLQALKEQCNNYWTDYYRGDLSQVMAILVHGMDYGVVGMRSTLEKQPHVYSWQEKPAESELYTEIKAGEQALFIQPMRYRNFLGVLDKLEVYGDRYGEVDRDIGYFVDQLESIGVWDEPLLDESVYVSLETALSSFYRNVYGSGQHFESWQFLSAENSDNGYNAAFSKKTQSEKLLVRLSDILKEDEYMEAFDEIR